MLPDVLPEPPGLEEPLVPDDPPVLEAPLDDEPPAPVLPALGAVQVRLLTQSSASQHPEMETKIATAADAMIEA
jgi:hypothetical protein